MKFQVTFKTPDVEDNAITDALIQSANALDLPEEELEELNLRIRCGSEDLPEELLEQRAELCTLLGKWIRYSEYVTIEIDTEAKTATVVEVPHR